MILRIFTQITSSFSGNTRTTLLSQENFADEKEKTLLFFFSHFHVRHNGWISLRFNILYENKFKFLILL